ncbi:MAG TPA: hypothetical protein VGY91_11210 [Chthoniobacterales bacterium]|jgi:hypothetical protein|nr:hypothetical protein [Chthoniobacterales bacterium]
MSEERHAFKVGDVVTVFNRTLGGKFYDLPWLPWVLLALAVAGAILMAIMEGGHL